MSSTFWEYTAIAFWIVHQNVYLQCYILKGNYSKFFMLDYFCILLRQFDQTKVYTGLTVMVFNATFNSTFYFSRIVAVCFIGGGNQSNRRKPRRPTASHWKVLSHNVVSSPPRYKTRIDLTTWVLIGTDCIGKSNSYTVTTTTAPILQVTISKIDRI